MIPAFEPAERRDAAVRRGSAGTIHMASRSVGMPRVRGAKGGRMGSR